jgi:hypothetical protein
MENLLDEARFQHLSHLLADEVLPLRCLTADFLLGRPCFRVHGTAVLDHLPGDSGDIRRFPCKHVGVSPEEGDEHTFLFFAQLCSNCHRLLGIVPWADYLGESSIF